MQKDRQTSLNRTIIKILILLCATVMLSGWSQTPPAPPNDKIAVIRPYEKIVKNKGVLGIYSTAACPQTTSGRIICINNIEPPTVDDVNKRFGKSTTPFFMKRFYLITELRQEKQLHKNGASVLLLVEPNTEEKTSFVGVSTEFLGRLLLTALAVVTKTNTYNTNSGAVVAGSTGAYKYTSNGEQALQTNVTTVQQNGYMVTALRENAAKTSFVREVLHCPSEVENDMWACLSVVAIALDAATSNSN